MGSFGRSQGGNDQREGKEGSHAASMGRFRGARKWAGVENRLATLLNLINTQRVIPLLEQARAVQATVLFGQRKPGGMLNDYKSGCIFAQDRKRTLVVLFQPVRRIDEYDICFDPRENCRRAAVTNLRTRFDAERAQVLPNRVDCGTALFDEDR